MGAEGGARVEVLDASPVILVARRRQLTARSVDRNAYNAYNAYNTGMVLNIRNLPGEVHSRLRVRAARNGRSMEAEARAILTEACPPESQPAAPLPAWVAQLYGGKKPTGVVEDLIRERRRESTSE